MSLGVTRKRFLKTASTGAAWVALLSAVGCGTVARTRNAATRPESTPFAEYAQTFRSRPDLLPPEIEITTQPRGTSPGYIFSTPAKGPGQHGPMILDNQGQPVWFRHSPDKQIRDFRTQRYRGEPVLT